MHRGEENQRQGGESKATQLYTPLQISDFDFELAPISATKLKNQPQNQSIGEQPLQNAASFTPNSFI